jgi:ferredoxin-NADP reductase
LPSALIAPRTLIAPGGTGAGVPSDQLDQCHDGVQVIYTITGGRSPAWTGHTGWVDATLLAQVAWPVAASPLAFICGPTSFVEAAAAGLTGLGYPSERVKTERFGGLGGP